MRQERRFTWLGCNFAGGSSASPVGKVHIHGIIGKMGRKLCRFHLMKRLRLILFTLISVGFPTLFWPFRTKDDINISKHELLVSGDVVERVITGPGHKSCKLILYMYIILWTSNSGCYCLDFPRCLSDYLTTSSSFLRNSWLGGKRGFRSYTGSSGPNGMWFCIQFGGVGFRNHSSESLHAADRSPTCNSFSSERDETNTPVVPRDHLPCFRDTFPFKVPRCSGCLPLNNNRDI
jgi:hypothetical protein